MSGSHAIIRVVGRQPDGRTLARGLPRPGYYVVPADGSVHQVLAGPFATPVAARFMRASAHGLGLLAAA